MLKSIVSGMKDGVSAVTIFHNEDYDSRDRHGKID
jgi:hypothetical protein